MDRHLVGLLLGTEEDWPAAFETLMRRLGPVRSGSGDEHAFDVERITIEPFDLRAKPRYDLVIDRLAYWYYVPREWLKKVALMDDVYLLNSPFTFQSMEKHAAYCAMMRLGLKVPETVLVPYKNPPDHAKWAYTARRYNQPFDLDEIADRMGYPLFMKPYDGGAWVGVTRIKNADDLHVAYDDSGQRLMHLQKAVEGYDVFARSLSIGAETMVMKFRPELPMHDRYEVAHEFLTPEVGDEVVTISRLVNAFFRWEFNSCENLVAGTEVHPIDYANACPDVALTSLHYYFPWAMAALVRWTVFTHGDRAQVLPAPGVGEVLRGRRPRGPLLLRKARRLPAPGRRVLRDRPLPRLLRQPPRAPRRGGAGVGGQRRVRRPARRDGQGDLPGPRARPVRRALPRPRRDVGARREGGGNSELRRSRTGLSPPAAARSNGPMPMTFDPRDSFGPEIAAVYDDVPRGDEEAAVARLAELAGDGPALELALGTGRLALPLAATGVRVDGIELSQAMIDRLRAKPGGDALTVVHGDMATTTMPERYRLVYVAFNSLMNLITQDDQVRCVANAAQQLREDGVFVVENVVPDLMYGLRPDREGVDQYVDAGAVGPDGVTVEVGRYDRATQRVDKCHVRLGAGGVAVDPLALRYVWPSELDLMARLAGLRLRHRWGGWAGEPFDGRSLRHVSVYGQLA